MTGSAFDIELDDLTLARAKRGDMDACAQIFKMFHPSAWAVAMRVCNCRETAHEVTQEAFITAFRRLKQFRGDAPFWGWMRRVVINHALSTLRKSRGPAVELEDHHAAEEPQQARIDDSLDLEAALSTLDEDDRRVVWLHDVEGYSHGEIAHMYGLTESFSKTRLSRARAKLRELVSLSSEPAAVGEVG